MFLFTVKEGYLPTILLLKFFFQNLIFTGKPGFYSVERLIEATSYSLSYFLQNEEQIPQYSHKI